MPAYAVLITKDHYSLLPLYIYTQVWNRRLVTLESVRDQMDSVVVLNILHSLEQAHSTYSQAFIHVHRSV